MDDRDKRWTEPIFGKNLECGDDGIINKWLVRRVSQGIPNFSTLVQKWSRLVQYSRSAKREELLGCAIAIFLFEQFNFGSFT